MAKAITVKLDGDTAERVRDIVYFSPHLTVVGFVRAAVVRELRRAARANGPPPRRTGPIKRGRPPAHPAASA